MGTPVAVRWDAGMAGSDPAPDTVDAYAAAVDPALRPLYDRVVRLVAEVAPEAAAGIAYGMPTAPAARRRLGARGVAVRLGGRW